MKFLTLSNRLLAACLLAAVPALSTHALASGETASASAPITQGVGVVRAVNPRAGTVSLDAGPIPAIGMPAMTMAYPVRGKSLFARLRIGVEVRFTLVQRGETMQIDSIEPAAAR